MFEVLAQPIAGFGNQCRHKFSASEEGPQSTGGKFSCHGILLMRACSDPYVKLPPNNSLDRTRPEIEPTP